MSNFEFTSNRAYAIINGLGKTVEQIKKEIENIFFNGLQEAAFFTVDSDNDDNKPCLYVEFDYSSKYRGLRGLVILDANQDTLNEIGEQINKNIDILETVELEGEVTVVGKYVVEAKLSRQNGLLNTWSFNTDVLYSYSV